MTAREKIIVVLMCITILYGAFELFGNKEVSRTASSPAAGASTELRAFITDITSKLIKEKVSEENRYLISQAGSRWTKDPFLLSADALKTRQDDVVQARPEESTPAPVYTFNYTGFLSLGDKKLAVINGREYTVGEALAVEGFYLKQITAKQVTIAKKSGSDVIKVPLYEHETSTPEPF